MSLVACNNSRRKNATSDNDESVQSIHYDDDDRKDLDKDISLVGNKKRRCDELILRSSSDDTATNKNDSLKSAPSCNDGNMTAPREIIAKIHDQRSSVVLSDKEQQELKMLDRREAASSSEKVYHGPHVDHQSFDMYQQCDNMIVSPHHLPSVKSAPLINTTNHQQHHHEHRQYHHQQEYQHHQQRQRQHDHQQQNNYHEDHTIIMVTNESYKNLEQTTTVPATTAISNSSHAHHPEDLKNLIPSPTNGVLARPSSNSFVRAHSMAFSEENHDTSFRRDKSFIDPFQNDFGPPDVLETNKSIVTCAATTIPSADIVNRSNSTKLEMTPSPTSTVITPSRVDAPSSSSVASTTIANVEFSSYSPFKSTRPFIS